MGMVECAFVVHIVRAHSMQTFTRFGIEVALIELFRAHKHNANQSRNENIRLSYFVFG